MAQRRVIVLLCVAVCAGGLCLIWPQVYPILEGSALYIYGNSSLQGTVNSTGAVDLDTTLNVNGAVDLDTTLNVNGAVDLDTTLNVNGATDLDTTLNVNGATDLDTTLNVDGATTQLGNVTVGKAATALTVALGIGTSSSTSRTLLLDDIGSASVANTRYLLRVSNGAATSYDQFNWKTVFDDSATTFPSSHKYVLQCNNGITSPATWVDAMTISGGDSLSDDCETFYTRDVNISSGANLDISDGGFLRMDAGAGAALGQVISSGDFWIDAISNANEFAWDGDSDDEADVTFDDADIGTDGGVCIGGDTCGGPSWRSGTGAPAGACVVGSLYSRTDGGAGTALYVCEVASGTWNIGLPYGACYGETIGWTQAAAVQNTWYLVSDATMVDGPLSGMTHDGNGKLTATLAGNYMVNMAISMENTGTNKHMEYGVSIDGAAPTMYQREFLGVVSQEQHGSLTRIIAVTAGQTIELAVRTTDTGTPDLQVDNLSVTVAQVGK